MPEIGSLADIVTVFGMIVVALIAASTQRRMAALDRQSQIEAQLSAARRDLYTEILRPFLTIVTPDAVWDRDPRTRGVDKLKEAEQQILSNAYQDAKYQLMFVGSDEVVRAFNELMQKFFRAGSTPASSLDVMPDYSALLLAIRRGAGNDATKLDKWEMLEAFVNDVREFKKRCQ